MIGHIEKIHGLGPMWASRKTFVEEVFSPAVVQKACAATMRGKKAP
jgi:hypothetical protein